MRGFGGFVLVCLFSAISVRKKAFFWGQFFHSVDKMSSWQASGFSLECVGFLFYFWFGECVGWGLWLKEREKMG